MPDPPAAPPPAPRPLPNDLDDWDLSFSRSMSLGMAGLPALIVIVVVLVTAPWNDCAIERHAKTTLAAPVKVEGTGVQLGETPMMSVELVFRDARGKEYTGSLNTVDDAILERASKHEATPIEYDSDDPSLFRFQGADRSALRETGMLTIVPWVTAIFVVPGFVGGLRARKRQRRRAEIYRDGEAALATVVAHTQSESSQNDEHLTLARYEFSSATGTHSGEIKTLTPPAVGSQLWVLYDRNDPKGNLPA